MEKGCRSASEDYATHVYKGPEAAGCTHEVVMGGGEDLISYRVLYRVRNYGAGPDPARKHVSGIRVETDN